VRKWIFHSEGGNPRDEISSHTRGLTWNPMLSTEMEKWNALLHRSRESVAILRMRFCTRNPARVLKGVVPRPFGREQSTLRGAPIGLGVHWLGVNEKKKLSPYQGRTAMQLVPSNCRGVWTQVYHDLHLNFAHVMEAHLHDLQGKLMWSNFVCETARYRGTTPLTNTNGTNF
jgi:hypothetical protein